MNIEIEQMRAMITTARAAFNDEVEASLMDIRDKARHLQDAIGEVSPYQALATLADYARERIGRLSK
jgi:hypothetical protein